MVAPESIECCLRRQAEKAASRVALTGPGRTPLSYSQLESLSARISATLNEFGVGRNHRVALALPTGPEALTCLLSVLRCAIALPLNPAGCEPEFKAQLTRLKADCLMVEPVGVGAAAAAARSLGIPVITVIPDLEAPAGTVTVQPEALLGPPFSCRFAQPGSLAVVMQTSGTTGMPRKVPLTHANLCAVSRAFIASLRLLPEDRLLGAIPIYHITGVAFVFNTVISGSSLCAAPGFYGARLADWMDEYRPSWIFASPASLRELVHHMKSRRDVIARCPLRLIRSGASAVPAQLQMEAEEVFQVPVVVGYGMTEAASFIACNPLPPAVRKPGSVGLPIGPEVMVLLPSGRPAAIGQQGKIV